MTRDYRCIEKILPNVRNESFTQSIFDKITVFIENNKILHQSLAHLKPYLVCWATLFNE